MDAGEKYVDSKILAAIVQLVYHCGLKAAEVLNLRIRDVLDGHGKLLEGIRIGSARIPISDSAQEILQAHMNYLAENHFKTDRTSPLFPQRIGQAYSARQLLYHLKPFLSVLPGRIGLEKIRQAGICRYYDELISQGASPEHALKTVSEFSRCSSRFTGYILQRTIKPRGRKIGPYRLLEETIEKFRLKDFSKKIDVERAADTLKDRIDKDTRLNEEDRQNLGDELDIAIDFKLEELQNGICNSKY